MNINDLKQSFETGWAGDVLALFAGAILPLAFAPMGYFPLAIASTVLLLTCWLYVSPRRALWRGWLYGLGQFGVGVSWVFISIHEFGNTSALLAAFFTASFVMVLALPSAVYGLCFKLISNLRQNHAIHLFIIFPALGMLFEWIRSWLLTGFPWLLLAYSQVDSVLKGYIPIIGAYGVGYLILLTSALLVYASLHYRELIKFSLALLIVLVIWLSGFGLAKIHWTQPFGPVLKVALVQGNIPQDLKWSPEHIRPTLKIYADATRQHWDQDLIIWPEAAVPIPYHFAKNFISELDVAAKQHHTSVITGIPVAVPNSFSYYNAMIALGQGSGHYYKKHLVPFGEYIPFGSFVRGLMGIFNLPMSDMIEGPQQQKDLTAGNIKLAPFICYEIAYPAALYSALPQANLLITISNDAWFGDSLAPAQHLQIGQFRAIQAGRELLFSGNNGITAIVNAEGHIVKSMPQFQRGVLVGTVQPMQGATPWVRIGNVPIILLLWFLIMGGLIFVTKKNEKNKNSFL